MFDDDSTILPKNFIELRKKMRNCEQMPGLNVLEHGFSVAKKFLELYNHYHYGTPLTSDWKLPDWIYDNRLWDFDISLRDILTYQIYHDCGKPYCLEYDENGNKHFPNHAEVSSEVWDSVSRNETVSGLILHDMDIHLIKEKDVYIFSTLPFYNILILTGLCEVHANADMFGGTESTSFKIKWKQINKRTKSTLKTKTIGE